MAPVARELSADRGVLEPLQTATSLEGQIQELRTVLEKYGDLPATLIGWSWGAMLCFLMAARYPACVRKLILVGSAVYEEQYAARIQETRFSRLSEEDKKEARLLMEALDDRGGRDKNASLAQLGRLFTRADAYKPLTLDTEDLEAQYHIYRRVWNDARQLRSSGELLKVGKQIQCPVVAIHGDYDTHPPEGVQKPLAAALKSFRFILLKNCGHLPWIGKEARDRFYEIIKEELKRQEV